MTAGLGGSDHFDDAVVGSTTEMRAPLAIAPAALNDSIAVAVIDGFIGAPKDHFKAPPRLPGEMLLVLNDVVPSIRPFNGVVVDTDATAPLMMFLGVVTD